MELATLQGKLLGLIKSSYQITDDDDPYIKVVAQSEHLRMVREVVLWWRAFGVGRFCVLTSTLLKQQGMFDEAVSAFVRKRRISPFVEKLGPTFLDELSHHEDSLVASLAQFELALIKVKKGDPNDYVIDWEYDPNAVLGSILNGLPLDRERIQASYQTVVSRNVPDLFHIVSVLQ